MATTPKIEVDPSKVDDLLNAYTFMLDREQTLPSDLADKFKHNMRYSREILAVLIDRGLAKLDTSTDFDFYAAVEGKPNPLQFFDKKMGTKTQVETKPTAKKAASKPAKPASKEYHPCACGCGENVPPKSSYRPGHDARHAGAVGRGIAADNPGGMEPAALRMTVEKFINPERHLLVAKAMRVAQTTWDKKSKAKHPSGASAPTEGIAKVGKNEVPARQFSDGSVEVLKNGDWVKASAAATKTFQVG